MRLGGVGGLPVFSAATRRGMRITLVPWRDRVDVGKPSFPSAHFVPVFTLILAWLSTCARACVCVGGGMTDLASFIRFYFVGSLDCLRVDKVYPG